MRFKKTLVAVALLLSVTVRGDAPTTQPTQAQIDQQKKLVRVFADQLSRVQSENEQLRQEVERLKAANNKLKAELFASNSRINSMIKPAPFTITPQPPLNPVPEHSKSFEFNGRNVYVIPLEDGTVHPTQSPETIQLKNRDLPLIDDRPRPNASK